MTPDIPKYTDDGSLREQDDVPLGTFLGDGDRAQPTERGCPFFSGREHEVNTFLTSVRALARGRPANATVTVEGPPGAGKSALLMQFQEAMRGFPAVGRNARRWLPVLMDGREADCPAEVMAAVDGAITLQMASDALDMAGQDDGNASRRLLNWLNEVIGDPVHHKVDGALSAARQIVDERGGAAFGFRVGAQRDLSHLSMRSVTARRRSAWRNWQVVLLIDEAQRVVDAGGALAFLHQGFPQMPISFCAFGLPGTAQALHNVGVSRQTVAYDLRLGALDAPASGSVVNRCFAQYGVTHGNRWKDAILARSANWPQHLAAYLNAALNILQESADSPDFIGDARRSSLSRAIRQGDASRASYYARRTERLDSASPFHTSYAQALVSWMRREGNSQPDWSQAEVLSFLKGPPLDLPEDKIIRFISAARHSGLLDRLPNGRLHLPIPSFPGYLLEEPLPPVHDEPEASAQSRNEDD